MFRGSFSLRHRCRLPPARPPAPRGGLLPRPGEESVLLPALVLPVVCTEHCLLLLPFLMIVTFCVPCASVLLPWGLYHCGHGKLRSVPLAWWLAGGASSGGAGPAAAGAECAGPAAPPELGRSWMPPRSQQQPRGAPLLSGC